MPWRESVETVRMERIAVVAPADRLRSVLVAVADCGVVEPERRAGNGGEALQALARIAASGADVRADRAAPALSSEAPDLIVLERERRAREIAGEAELDEVRGAAVIHGAVAAIAGWTPAAALDGLAARLHPLGGAVVQLPMPRGTDPPTQIVAGGAGETFGPLVETYATVPYADLDPSLFAGLAYVVMFGMMFGDVGHGAFLLLCGFLLWRGGGSLLARFRRAAPFVIGSGSTSIAFGFAYGEAFGPTGLVPVLWLAPLEQPTILLAAGVAVGAALLAISYVLGSINRWREGGPVLALVALSGIAGSALYVGLALTGFGWIRGSLFVAGGGALLAVAGLVLGFIGLFAEAGGRATGAVQAGIELFDAVVRLGANTVSFARLAAFGMTHAALGAIVWSGTVTVWQHGPLWWALAIAVFAIGNIVAFALEALVAGVQALRLEYYELFSRIFTGVGRRFQPWHVPTLVGKEPS